MTCYNGTTYTSSGLGGPGGCSLYGLSSNNGTGAGTAGANYGAGGGGAGSGSFAGGAGSAGIVVITYHQ